MDTIFNLELLRSVYVFKDLNSSIKDVNTSLEKTTSGIRSLSDSFSSFTKFSVEKVKDLSKEFRDLTKNIAQPQVAKISYNTTGAINEIAKVSAAAQNFSQISYKENLSKSTKITQPNQEASGQEKDTKEESDSSFLSKAQEVMLKIKDVTDTFNSVYDVLDKLKIINRNSAIPEILPAAAESGGLSLMQRILPKIMPMITSISAGLDGVMASIGVVGEGLLAIPGVNVVVAIAAAVIALIIAVKLLMEHSRSFNQMLGYIGGAGRAVFHNIGVYATRIWQLVLKPFIGGFVSAFKVGFSIVRDYVQAFGEGIMFLIRLVRKAYIEAFNIGINIIKGAWTIATSIFKGIWGIIIKVWSGASEVLSDFKKWIHTYILDPITNTFSSVGEWIPKIVNKAINGLNKMFAPIKNLWNQIFSSKGTLNVHQEGLKDSEAAGKKFDAKKEKEKADKLAEDNAKNGGKESNGKPKATSNIGGLESKMNWSKEFKVANLGNSAFNDTRSRNSAFSSKGSMDGGSGMGGQKSVGNLNITKLIENMNIYNQNSTMSKDAIIQMVREALLTAVADFTLAQKDTY